jgi:cytochrome c-type biogenesis protein CcmH
VRSSLLGLLLCLLVGNAVAIDPLPFTSPEQEQRFRKLAAELRCVMCQNESLAESNAGIAGDLRRQIFDLMTAGRSNDEIKTFLTERYGDFVLYNPPLKPSNWLLWFAPLAILLAGAGLIVVTLRRRAAQFRQSVAAPETDSREDW